MQPPYPPARAVDGRNSDCYCSYMRFSLRLILLPALSIAGVLAQPVSIGAIAGVPLLYPAPAPCCSVQNYTDESRPYTVGPSVEFRLPAGFAVEIDALYRRLGVRYSGLTVFASYDAFTGRARGNAWEFPLLAKYYFRRGESWQPFAGAGPAMRWLRATDRSDNVGLFGSSYQSVDSFQQFITGETVAGGVRFRSGRVQWLPQFRYSRWNGSGLLTQSNEATILLGIAF